MKKVCLTAMMLVLMVTGAYAQANIGLKAGLNYASIAGDETDDVKGRLGYHVGGMASFGITESVFIQPELVLSLQGAAYDSDAIDASLNLTYINVPVMAKVMLAEGLNLQFGPQFGFLVSSKFKIEDESEDVEDVSGFDFGLGVGAGYEMQSGLNFGLRYNYGLSNINDGEGSDDFKQNNSVLQLSVGYFFGGN